MRIALLGSLQVNDGRARCPRRLELRPERRPSHRVPQRPHRGLRRRQRPPHAGSRLRGGGRVPLTRRERLIVGTGPTGVGLLDAITMQWISRPSAAQAGLVGYYTAWSDDGSLVASVNEGRLSYWDGRSGARLGTATVAWAGVPTFSKDNKRLLVAGDDGSVRSWDLDPRSWVAAACRLAGRALTEQEWRNYLPDRPFVRVCAS